MILIKLFKLDAITLKQRLMVEFFIIFMMILTLRLLKESLVIFARLWRCLRLWMEVPILHLNGIIERRIWSYKSVIILLRVDPAKRKSIPNCDYYCDMLYLLLYFTFVKLPAERHSSCEASSTISCECHMIGVELEEVSQVQDHPNPEVTLLDLYSSCGAMSIGLCLGIDLFGLHFVTRWAVNLN